MEITRKEINLYENENSELSSWGVIQNYYKFNNYTIEDIHIKGHTPQPITQYFFNKNEVLKEYYRIGKNFYNIYEELLKKKKAKKKYKEVNNQVDFIEIGNLNADIKSNNFINNFLPSYALKHVSIEECSKIILDYCYENGLPLNAEEEQDIIHEDTNNDCKNIVETDYFCLVQPFISISTLVYIFLEIQSALKYIFSYNDTKITSITKFKDITSDDKFSYKNYTQILENFLWFLDYDIYKIKNIDEININEFCNRFINKFNLVTNSTAYLGLKKYLYFSPTKQRFFYIDVYSSVLAMAWECLTKESLSFILDNNENKSYFKICQWCNEGFFTDQINENHCSDNCRNLDHNKKSAESYKKVNNLHKELKNIYETLSTKQLSKLSKNRLSIIEKYVNLNASGLKKMKCTNRVKELNKNINILKSLK